MARSWLIDCRGLARKVKSATLASANQIKDCGANRECPNCHYRIDNSDVSHEWPGLPVGVKFDPSDVELIGHLAAKCGVRNSKPHAFIDEFIPTIESEEGICYTHPKHLPGAKKDGSSIHFFYKTINAYATGQRKRRKIQDQDGLRKEHVRWHKTGKTKPVMENGVQVGCKKIMVLYVSSKKGTKPDKSNWVMHQYHLGTDEDEKEGQYVVSKIFYQQQKQTERNDNSLITEESDVGATRTSPRTPKTIAPDPPRPTRSALSDDVMDDDLHKSAQATEIMKQVSYPSSSAAQLRDEMGCPSWLAGESQPVDFDGVDDPLLCNEIFDCCAPLSESRLNQGTFTSFAHDARDMPGGEGKAACGIADLEKLEFDTPPDFELADLQFGSQDSILGWLDRI